MKHRIVVRFARKDIPRARNLGEEIHRALGDNPWASISIDEVDRSTNEFAVVVRSARHVPETVRIVEKLVAKAKLAATIDKD